MIWFEHDHAFLFSQFILQLLDLLFDYTSHCVCHDSLLWINFISFKKIIIITLKANMERQKEDIYISTKLVSFFFYRKRDNNFILLLHKISRNISFIF